MIILHETPLTNARRLPSIAQSPWAEDERQAKLYPDEELGKRSREWYRSISPGSKGFHFDDTKVLSCGALDVAIEWLRSSCLPECPDNCQLGPFTAESLRRVLAAVHVACLFRVKLENVSDGASDPNQHVLTHVLSWRYDELIDWLFRLTYINEDQLRPIVSMLTFDAEPGRVTLAHKPFVLGASDRVFLLPRLFLDLPLSQMVVGALNLSPAGKTAYSNASTLIEKEIVKRIASGISSGCLKNAIVATERTFRLPDGTEITPDLVLLSADAVELLVVDIKNATPPFGAGDMATDLTEWGEKWEPQMAKYVAAFQKEPQILSQHFNAIGTTCTPKVFGVILLRWPFPVPVESTNGMGAIDWPSLHENLTSGEIGRSMEDLVKWIRERPDCGIVHNLKWTEKIIQVDDWTYRYSVLSNSAVPNAS